MGEILRGSLGRFSTRMRFPISDLEKWFIRGAFGMLLVLGFASCRGDRDPRPANATSPNVTRSSTVKESPPAQVDAEALLKTMQSLVTAYNGGSYVEASRYVADSVVNRCGGASSYAQAQSQNFRSEKLAYSIDSVEVTETTAGTTKADVYYSSKDVNTGEAVDRRQGNGLTFIQSGRPDIEWVLNDMFPLGVGAFCR
jgi:hypothetical protein